MKRINKETPADTEVSQKSTQIIPQENSIVNFNVESLMAKAIEHGLSPETMEKFLAMRQQLKAEWAREQFDKAMAAFQAECPTIEKKKQGYNYKYAPLESIVEQVKDLLAKFGFSYTFDTTEGENAIVVYCKVKHIAGHTESSQIQISKETTTKMNASQQSGAATTYGKRYAFCNAFGILTGDEDTDAASETKTYKTFEEGKGQSKYRGSPGLDAKPNEPDISLGIRIDKCDTLASLDLVSKDVMIAYNNQKITKGQFEILKEIGSKKREELAKKEGVVTGAELDF